MSLKEDSVDLKLKPGKAAVRKAARYLTGSSILTPHAKFQLQNQIKAYLDKNPKGDGAAANTIAKVWEKLKGDKDRPFHALGQSLSGFNEALLMQKQTLQLPIADPLGFEDAQRFAEAVRRAVGPSTRSAPPTAQRFPPDPHRGTQDS